MGEVVDALSQATEQPAEHAGVLDEARARPILTVLPAIFSKTAPRVSNALVTAEGTWPSRVHLSA